MKKEKIPYSVLKAVSMALAILLVTMMIPAAAITGSALSPDANGGMVSFSTDFNWADDVSPNASLQPSEQWNRVNGIIATTKDERLVLSSFNTHAAMLVRAINESVQNQQLMVDLCSLDTMEQRAYLRVTQSSPTSAAGLNGYFVSVVGGSDSGNIATGSISSSTTDDTLLQNADFNNDIFFIVMILLL